TCSSGSILARRRHRYLPKSHAVTIESKTNRRTPVQPFFWYSLIRGLERGRMHAWTFRMRSRSQVYNQPLDDKSLVACPHCDLPQRIPHLPPGAYARCPRCSQELWHHRKDSINRTLALTVAAAWLYIIANSVPMLGIAFAGRQASTTVIGGAEQLWTDGRGIIAILVLFTAVIAPALQISFMLALTLGASAERPGRWAGALLRHLPVTRTWSMIEVMMLGVMVALVKIADYARVTPGVALFALAALVFLIAAVEANFDSKEVWDKIEWAADD